MSMRDENRERKRYLRERRRYQRYQREQQEAAAGAGPDTRPDRPAPPSEATDGNVARVPTPGEAESRAGRFRRCLCSIASKLHPRAMSRRASRDEVPTEPPRHLPHWHGARPKPTPAYLAAESQPVGSRPGVSRCRARRHAAARGDAPEGGPSAGARMATSAEAQGSGPDYCAAGDEQGGYASTVQTHKTVVGPQVVRCLPSCGTDRDGRK